MDSASVKALYDLKALKLQEQKALADTASEHLAKLNDSSKKTRKSLQAATAAGWYSQD